MTDDAAARLQSELAPLAADEIYLSPERRERACAALRSINDFKKRRNEELRPGGAIRLSSMRELFDGPAHIAKAEGGWRPGSMRRRRNNPSQLRGAAFAARMAEIEAMLTGCGRSRLSSESARNASPVPASLLEQARRKRENGSAISLRETPNQGRARRLYRAAAPAGYKTRASGTSSPWPNTTMPRSPSSVFDPKQLEAILDGV